MIKINNFIINLKNFFFHRKDFWKLENLDEILNRFSTPKVTTRVSKGEAHKAEFLKCRHINYLSNRVRTLIEGSREIKTFVDTHEWYKVRNRIHQTYKRREKWFESLYICVNVFVWDTILTIFIIEIYQFCFLTYVFFLNTFQ